MVVVSLRHAGNKASIKINNGPFLMKRVCIINSYAQLVKANGIAVGCPAKPAAIGAIARGDLVPELNITHCNISKPSLVFDPVGNGANVNRSVVGFCGAQKGIYIVA